LDVDTGIDDALAILLALHARREIRVLAITTVSSNTSAEQAALKTRYLLERFGLAEEIPVAVGAEKSLARGTPLAAPEIHAQTAWVALPSTAGARDWQA
jgi:purine nucleosidase